MAITQEQAFNQIMAEVAEQTSLAGVPKAQDTATTFVADLTEGKAGIVRTVGNAVAYAIALQSQQIDRALVELQALADKSEPDTDAWLAEMARTFRWNHDPFPANTYRVRVSDDNAITWSQEALADDAALIVGFSSAESIGGKCILKVNGSSGGLPVALPDNQRGAVEEFIRRIQPVGASITVVSRSPDLLTIAGTIYFNPLYVDGLQAAVEAAILAFLQKLPFNGVIVRNDLELAIRKVPGVMDVVFNETKARKAGQPFGSPQAVVFNRQYKTYAGSCLFDLANSNLTYLPG